MTGEKAQYLFKDHLGSVDVITDAIGSIEQELSFDAWGQRRSGIDWNTVSVTDLLSFDHSITTRGFTGHEMLDEVGLIHMNGRIYDARLGRFLQADPFVDGVDNTQGLNRYSYVHNNPLNATDPSGFLSFSDIVDAIVLVVAVVIEVYCGGCGVGANLVNWWFAGPSQYLHAAEAAYNSFAGGNALGGILHVASAFVGGGVGSNGGHNWAEAAANTSDNLMKDNQDRSDKLTIQKTVGQFGKDFGSNKYQNGAKYRAYMLAVNASQEVVEENEEDLASEVQRAAAHLIGLSHDSAKSAAVALHTNMELMSLARSQSREIWAVIDLKTFAIKEVGVGTEADAAGVYTGRTFRTGDSVWHSHPSPNSGKVWRGDLASIAGSGARQGRWIFASGDELSGIDLYTTGYSNWLQVENEEFGKVTRHVYENGNWKTEDYEF